MKKIILLTLLSFPLLGNASAYMEMSLGGQFGMPKGESGSYKKRPSFASELSVGVLGSHWDFSVDGTYAIGRQKAFSFNYAGNKISDDFNLHSFTVGPTLKYHVNSDSSNWSWAPFVGIFYNHSTFENSSNMRDQLTGETEDNSHEAWGYGGKLGVQFRQQAIESTWLESINYKIFASYTKYREFEGDYQSGVRVLEYKGDAPDKMHDYSVGVLVGFSFGDKVYQKAKNALGITK